jgi:hypothetical protein
MAYNARVKESAGENVSLPPPQGESCFQEAAGFVYCDETGNSSCEFYKSQVTKQQDF